MRALIPLLIVLLCWPIPCAGAPAKGARGAHKALLKGVKKITRAVRRQRGLKWRRKLKTEVRDREGMVKQRAAYLEGRLAKRDLVLEAQVLERLGALDRGVDLKAALLGLLTSAEPGPFYDHASGKLFIAGWLPLEKQRPALMLAACHALLDQRYRVGRFIARARGRTDAALARRALLQGDCAAVTLELMLGKHRLELSNLGGRGREILARGMAGKGAGGPGFVRGRLMFPYLAGYDFVSQARGRYAWSLMNKVYRKPPVSTEQVIHYRGYWDRERPDRIRARKLGSLKELPEVVRDTVGEAQLSLLLRGAVGEEGAARAAQGWGADLMVGHRAEDDSGLPLLIHLTSWDSEIDAREFAAAQRHHLLAMGLKRAEGAKETFRYTDPDGALWSQRMLRRQVLTIMGAPADLHDAIVDDVLKRWRVNGRRLKP